MHYWASPLEAQLCAGQDVALVGAGNSAGQAAVYLASQVAKVWLLVRGRSLDASMSRYLVDRIAATPNIELVTDTQVTRSTARTACWRRSAGVAALGRRTRRPIRHLFLFIGAEPNTDWLAGSGVALDDKGFIRTGGNVAQPARDQPPGVFAIGDVRCGFGQAGRRRGRRRRPGGGRVARVSGARPATRGAQPGSEDPDGNECTHAGDHSGRDAERTRVARSA